MTKLRRVHLEWPLLLAALGSAACGSKAGSPGNDASAGAGALGGSGGASSGGSGSDSSSGGSGAGGGASHGGTAASSGGSTNAPGGSTSNAGGSSGSSPSSDAGAGEPPWVWADHFGGDSDKNVRVHLAVDGAGHIVFGGEFEATLDFGDGKKVVSAGGKNDFVAEFDEMGRVLWHKAYDADQGKIAVDGTSNVLLTGRANAPIDVGGGLLTAPSPSATNFSFVAKLTPAGDHVFSKSFAGGAPSVAGDAHGNVILAGTAEGAVDLGAGSLPPVGAEDLFVAKLDPSGHQVWMKRYGTHPGDAGSGTGSGFNSADVTVDAAGDVIVLSGFSGHVDLDGTELSPSVPDATVLAKLDGDGRLLWSRVVPASFGFHGLAVDATGAVSVLASARGYTSADVDFGAGPVSGAAFVARFDASGKLAWANGFQKTVLTAIALDPAGGVAVVGFDMAGAVFGPTTMTTGGVVFARIRADGTVSAAGYSFGDLYILTTIVVDTAGLGVTAGSTLVAQADVAPLLLAAFPR